MELYHNAMSSCAQKVRLVLREKALNPVEHALNLRAGDAQRPEYLRLNPNGVVPTLVDRGHVIIESAVICEYLEDAYPEIPLRPEDPAGRANMRLWTMLPDTGFHRSCAILSVASAFRHQMLAKSSEERERQLAAKPDSKVSRLLATLVEHGTASPLFAEAVADFDVTLTRMEAALTERSWLAGADYSLADAAMLPYVVRLAHLSLDKVFLEGKPAVASWYARSTARANFAAISDYLDPAYLGMMAEKGAEAQPAVRSILAG